MLEEDACRGLDPVLTLNSFAIPVTTRYVADFLGFGHLIRSEKNSKAPHSENEIYQHITNCQVFLSYNADETKLLKRRKAFKSSMEFLYNLTLNGNIYEASRSMISQRLFGRKRDNSMTELGFQVAQHVLKYEHSTSKAAAILVFVGLHAAYNSVLAVSTPKIVQSGHYCQALTLEASLRLFSTIS